MAMKKALARESWPVLPTSSVRPIAPIAADMANRPVCIQNASAYCGSHSSTRTRTTQPIFLYTRDLTGPEQAPRPPQQHGEEHDVGHDVAQPAAEERELVLVARGQLDRDADDQPADERARGGVEPTEHRD